MYFKWPYSLFFSGTHHAPFISMFLVNLAVRPLCSLSIIAPAPLDPDICVAFPTGIEAGL